MLRGNAEGMTQHEPRSEGGDIQPTNLQWRDRGYVFDLCCVRKFKFGLVLMLKLSQTLMFFKKPTWVFSPEVTASTACLARQWWSVLFWSTGRCVRTRPSAGMWQIRQFQPKSVTIRLEKSCPIGNICCLVMQNVFMGITTGVICMVKRLLGTIFWCIILQYWVWSPNKFWDTYTSKIEKGCTKSFLRSDEGL